MSYIRHKIIQGHRYAYEVSAYWDAKAKMARQKVKYLGAVNEKGTIIKKSDQKRTEKLILDFGDAYLLHEFFKTTSLYSACSQAMNKYLDTLMPLLFYRLCYPASMSQAKTWFSGNFARLLFPKVELSSQRISEFLEWLGEEAIQRQFLQAYLSNFSSTTKGVIIDATGLPNQIHVSFNAWGYHDSAIEKQMRFLCVLDQESALPLFFRYLPGNILDVSTLKRTIAELDKLGIKQSFMLMDAGYFSEENLRDLHSNHIQFVTRLPASRQLYKELIETEGKDLEQSKHAVRCGRRGLFVKVVKTQLYDQEIYAYLVLDPERKGREVNKLLLRHLEDDLTAEEIDRRLKYRGVMILVSSFLMSKQEAVPYYYLRQTVEHVFGFFKDDLKVLPLRRHNDKTLSGYLFFLFVALIFFLECRKKLSNRYTVEQALLMMRNVKCKVYDEEVLVAELNKQQNEISKLFNVLVPKKAGI